MKTDRLPTWIRWGYAGLTLAGTLLYSLSLVLSYDADPGYFRAGILPTLFYIAAGIALFAAPLCLLITRQRPAADFSVRGLFDPMPLHVRLPQYLAALALLANGIRQLLHWQESGTRYPVLVLVGACLAILGCLALIPGCGGLLRAIGISALVLWGACGIVTHYFNWYVPMNSPLKVMQFASLLTMMLFLLNHAFTMAGAPRPRRVLLTDCYLIFFGLCQGCSLWIACLAGIPLPDGYLIGSAVSLFLGISALTRLFLPSAASAVPSPESSKGDAS